MPKEKIIKKYRVSYSWEKTDRLASEHDYDKLSTALSRARGIVIDPYSKFYADIEELKFKQIKTFYGGTKLKFIDSKVIKTIRKKKRKYKNIEYV